MFQHMSALHKNLFAFVAVCSMSLLGLTYTGFHGAAAVFYPAAGVYAALYFLFRKQVLPGLMIGILAANLIYRLTQIDEAIWITLILSLIFLGSNLVEMIVFSTACPTSGTEDCSGGSEVPRGFSYSVV
jgi:hypothetical protein